MHLVAEAVFNAEAQSRKGLRGFEVVRELFMDKLWKWVMHLNAKAFCLAATFGFFLVAAYCGWSVLYPPTPLQDGGSGPLPELPAAWELGTLNFVSNQLAADNLTIPVDPFRPTIEAIFTNETERAAFLKALKAAQNAAAGVSGSSLGNKKEDPFAHLRKKDSVPGGAIGPDGKAMVTPKLSFMGFFQRPDGQQAAMFYDSVANTTIFYESGKQVHGVEILSANVREAEIRFADGTTRKLPIGESIELAAEPAKTPPPKKGILGKLGAVAAAVRAGAKPGVQQPKPGVKPGAVKPAVKPGAVKPGADKRQKKQQPQP
jgi:hypothetical protein